MVTTSKLIRGAWPIALAAGVAVVALALWQPSSSRGFIIVGGAPAPLGLVDLNAGQTLRISVANVVGFDPQPDPPACSLQVGFVDAENTTVGNPNIFELRPGIGRSFDHVALGNGSVRPVVVDLAPKDDCPAVVTGQVLDRGAVSGMIIYGVPVNPMVFAKS